MVGRRWGSVAGVSVVAMVLAAVSPQASADNPPRDISPTVSVEAVSVGRDGRPANYTDLGQMSDDGRMVLLASTADSLGTDHPTPGYYLYVRDRLRNTTTVVTARSDGTAVRGHSGGGGSVSGDGRHAVFYWHAGRLSPTGQHSRRYVFVKNLQTGRLDSTRLSGTGPLAGRRLRYLSISGTSQHARFVNGTATFARDGATPRSEVCYLLDRDTGRVRWISRPDRHCSAGTMSEDGRYLVYELGHHNRVYRFDRTTGDTTEVPRHPIDDELLTYRTLFSDDGKVMVTTHVDLDTGRDSAVVRRTQDMSVIEVLGYAGATEMDVGAVSASGRYLAVTANPDLFRWYQVYRYDRVTGRFVLLSVTMRGRPANWYSSCCTMSNDGRSVGFNTEADNLVAGDVPRSTVGDAGDAFLATIGRSSPNRSEVR